MYSAIPFWGIRVDYANAVCYNVKMWNIRVFPIFPCRIWIFCPNMPRIACRGRLRELRRPASAGDGENPAFQQAIQPAAGIQPCAGSAASLGGMAAQTSSRCRRGQASITCFPGLPTSGKDAMHRRIWGCPDGLLGGRLPGVDCCFIRLPNNPVSQCSTGVLVRNCRQRSRQR